MVIVIVVVALSLARLARHSNDMEKAQGRVESIVDEAKSEAGRVCAEPSWKVLDKIRQDDGGLAMLLLAKKGFINTPRTWLRVHKTHHFYDEFENLALDSQIRLLHLSCQDESWRGEKESYLAPLCEKTAKYFADRYGD